MRDFDDFIVDVDFQYIGIILIDIECFIYNIKNE